MAGVQQTAFLNLKILLTGATGFIGSRLRAVLLAQGNELVCPARHPGPTHPHCQWIHADLGADDAPFPSWLRGVHAVINTVGIFREQPGASFAVLHTQMPVALFEACVAAGVHRVIQVSALGASADAPEDFLRSKHAADEALLALPLNATVVMPSLVFGAQGASAGQMLALASLPVMLLPAGGHQAVQPVHLDDLVAAVVALLRGAHAGADRSHAQGRRVPLVGPQAMSFRDYLSGLRRGLGLRATLQLAVPALLMRLGARLGEHLPGAVLDRAAWSMLQRGNTASARPITALLQRPPRTLRHFIEPDRAEGLRLLSQLAWLLPLLRLALALVWGVAAVATFGLWPVADSQALLGRAGVSTGLQPLALYGAALLALALGVATLWPWRQPARRRWLWAAQAVLIAGTSLVVAVQLPEFWLHPLGPMIKNLPLLALLLLLWTLEPPAPRLRRAGGRP